jgi:hypothetical protein
VGKEELTVACLALNFIQKRTKSGAGMLAVIQMLKNLCYALNSFDFRPQKNNNLQYLKTKVGLKYFIWSCFF